VQTYHDTLIAPSRPCWVIIDQAPLQSLLAQRSGRATILLQ
jgi:hypothetical protein